MTHKEPEIRYFTVAEANALLPALREHLDHLQRLVKTARARYREMEMIKAVGYRPDGSLIMLYDYHQAKEAFESAVGTANDIVEQLHRTGIQVKSIDLGLVDFPAVINGREVLLCWQQGEPEVGHYHPPAEGFRGRRPLGPDDDDTPALREPPPDDPGEEDGLQDLR